MIWPPLWAIGEFASTVTTRLSLLFCLPRAPKFPEWWTLSGWSLIKHLGLILHLLRGGSIGLIITLLMVCLVSRCPGSAFSYQTHRQLPVRSLHFWPKINHASRSLYFPVYCCLYPSHLLIREAPFYAILRNQQSISTFHMKKLKYLENVQRIFWRPEKPFHERYSKVKVINTQNCTKMTRTSKQKSSFL